MEMMTSEHRRMVKRFVVNRPDHAQGLRIEQLMNQLRQEVQHTREERPELREYHLYDLTFSFHDNGLLLNMEFRK